MSHIDLEQGRIGDPRQSFTDGEGVVSCFHSNAYGYYDYDNDEYSRSVSSVSDESEKTVCRICQLEVGSYGQGLIELGCSCKDDLAFAHRQCAETWFKLKGNEVCEICHSEARNVSSGNEMIEEEEEVVVVEMEEEGEGDASPASVGEDGESWWQRQMVLIFLLICWVSPFPFYFLAIRT